MKFLKLKFTGARLIRERNDKNRIGYNRFFHPINTLHVYNSLCVLMDRTPKPQLRETDDRFMPVYDDLMKVVSEGFIKIDMVMESETITIIKKDWNANLKTAQQYTWKDCQFVTGTLFPLFKNQVSEILNTKDVTEKSFDEVISDIQSLGIKEGSGEIKYTDNKITNLINWCSINNATVISNYIENKQESSRATNFGKRVNRGVADTSVFNGIIYIPLTQELFDEFIKYTPGHSTILDGGLVRVLGYSEVYEDELEGFKKISQLNSTKKFNNQFVKAINWEDTIYNKIDLNDIEGSIKKILESVEVDISQNAKEYGSMMEKINSTKGIDIPKIASKLNFFIENAINKQYKI